MYNKEAIYEYTPQDYERHSIAEVMDVLDVILPPNNKSKKPNAR